MREQLNQILKEMDTSNLDSAEMAEMAEMLEMAENFDDLDAEDFEQMDDAEYADYLDYLDSLDNADRRKRHRRGSPKKPVFKKGHHQKHAKNNLLKGMGKKNKMGAIGAGTRYSGGNKVSKKAPIFGSPSYIQELMTSSEGDLNITVTRQTATIAFTLPYILFGLNGFQSSFTSTIKAYLPTAVTMAASVATDGTGDVLLTYNDGTNTDIIRISLTGSQISYSEFLQSMNSNFFKTLYIRQEYPNDANLLTASSQPINFGLLSALGMKNANSMLPRARRLSSDYQTYIINLFMPEQSITSDFSFVQKAPIVAGYVTAWDVYMSKRVNLNNLS